MSFCFSTEYSSIDLLALVHEYYFPQPKLHYKCSWFSFIDWQQQTFAKKTIILANVHFLVAVFQPIIILLNRVSTMNIEQGYLPAIFSPLPLPVLISIFSLMNKLLGHGTSWVSVLALCVCCMHSFTLLCALGWQNCTCPIPQATVSLRQPDVAALPIPNSGHGSSTP